MEFKLIFVLFTLPLINCDSFYHNAIIIFCENVDSKTCIVNQQLLIRLPTDEIKTILGAQNASQITALKIVNKEVKFFPQNLHLKFPNLEVLEISNSGLTEIHQKNLQNLKNLKILKIAGNLIKELEKGLFIHNKAIEEINFDDNQIKFVHSEVFSGLSKLKKLSLRGNLCVNSAGNLQATIKIATENCTRLKEFNAQVSELEVAIKNRQFLRNSEKQKVENLEKKVNEIKEKLNANSMDGIKIDYNSTSPQEMKLFMDQVIEVVKQFKAANQTLMSVDRKQEEMMKDLMLKMERMEKEVDDLKQNSESESYPGGDGNASGGAGSAGKTTRQPRITIKRLKVTPSSINLNPSIDPITTNPEESLETPLIIVSIFLILLIILVIVLAIFFIKKLQAMSEKLFFVNNPHYDGQAKIVKRMPVPSTSASNTTSKMIDEENIYDEPKFYDKVVYVEPSKENEIISIKGKEYLRINTVKKEEYDSLEHK